ncbi:MAG TPA: tetratricopeptide repeat protein [Pyrinomonadaceae bacterium]
MVSFSALQLRRLICLAVVAAALFVTESHAIAQDDVDRAFARAAQLHESGDIEGAIRGYQTILSAHPNRADVRSNLGAAYSRLGRYEDAIEQYQKALTIDGRNQAIRFNLAMAYYKAALFAEAAAELTRFIPVVPQNFPERSNAVLVLADCQVRIGEYKKVIDSLSPLAEAEPNNRTIAFLLGSALIGDGQLNKGQLLIDRVFHDEDSAEAHLLLGSILLLADDGHGAIKQFERALTLNPKLAGLQSWYGRALMRMGDTERARTAFRGELADNQNDFNANLFLGMLLRQEKQFDEALQYETRAVHLRPRDQFARFQLAAVYAGLSKTDDARLLLEGVVKEFPDFVEARALLSSVYYRLNRKADGDREKAIVDKLHSEQQAKQPGSQQSSEQNLPSKPPEHPR